MKQLGNLAVVCAQRPDVLMQIYGSKVSVHTGEGPERVVLTAKWDDDETIQSIIRVSALSATINFPSSLMQCGMGRSIF